MTQMLKLAKKRFIKTIVNILKCLKENIITVNEHVKKIYIYFLSKFHTGRGSNPGFQPGAWTYHPEIMT